jgi:hypothetical protein
MSWNQSTSDHQNKKKQDIAFKILFFYKGPNELESKHIRPSKQKKQDIAVQILVFFKCRMSWNQSTSDHQNKKNKTLHFKSLFFYKGPNELESKHI